MKLKRAFKFKLEPGDEQLSWLSDASDLCRRIYNDCLRERSDNYKKHKKSVRGGDQVKRYAKTRNEQISEKEKCGECDGVLWTVPSTMPRDVVKTLDVAFKNFFESLKNTREWIRSGRKGDKPRKVGYPQLKGKRKTCSLPFLGTHAQSMYILRKSDGRRMLGMMSLKGGKRDYVIEIAIRRGVSIKIPFVMHRALIGEIRTARIVREENGWHVAISCRIQRAEPPENVNPPVAIDLGIAKFATFSDDSIPPIENPRFLQKEMKELRRLNRQINPAQGKRRQYPMENSNRTEARKKKKAKLEAKIARKRAEFLHNESRKIVNSYSLIAIENLNVSGMIQGRLSKQIADVGWAEFRRQLGYKSQETGSEVIAVPPQYTSETCSMCGHCVKEKGLAKNRKSQSLFLCERCGIEMNADRNAAKNILRLALEAGAGKRQRV